MLTSQEALQRFFDALAAADDVRGSTPTDSREGVNVSIVAFIGTQDASNKARKPVGRYLAKDSLMPMDLSAVAFAMCEIVFFRIICAIGQGRHLPGTFDRSYGSPMSLPEADRQGVDFLVEKDVLSEEAAARWLKTCLTESEVALV